MSMVKGEENNLRRSQSLGDRKGDGRGEVVRRVKRRRRESGNGEQAKEVNHEADAAAPTTVKRSSRFRGVSRHRWTGRYEAHLWDKLSWNVTQKKKGKQGMSLLTRSSFHFCILKFYNSCVFFHVLNANWNWQFILVSTILPCACFFFFF